MRKASSTPSSQLGKQPRENNSSMPKTFKRKRASSAPSADRIAEMATRGQDVSAFFTGEFTVVRPIQRVNVDLTHGMLQQLDARAARYNVSRQAVIKTLLAQALADEPRRRSHSK